MTPTVRSLDLANLWRLTQALTVRRWAGSDYDLDELLGVASESFINHVDAYDEWCQNHGYNPTDVGLFVTLVKKRVHWDILNVVRTVHFDLPVENEEGEPRTDLRVPFRDSALHHTLVARVRKLKLKERLVLALVCFEEMPVGKIGQLLGTTQAVAGRAITLASERILLTAMQNTMTMPVEQLPEKPGVWKPPQTLTDWITRHYNTDIDNYLRYVEIHYDADVSYLVEMIDRGNGSGPQRGIPGRPSKLTDAQKADIIERLTAGRERHEDIAKDYKLSRSAVSMMNKHRGAS